MTDAAEVARLYIQAQSDPTPESISALLAHVSDDTTLKGRGTFTGPGAIAQQLANQNTAANFRWASWSEPKTDGNGVTVSGRLPIEATVGGYDLRFEFGADGKIAHIEQVTLPAPPLPPSPLKLDDEMKQTIIEAWRGATILVISVDSDGRAIPSLRGTVQPFGDDGLAFWARNAEGSTVGALETNPNLTFFYRNPPARTTYIFYGRGRVTKDDKERRAVYDNSPEPERNADPDIRGVAVIADLDRIEGIGPNGRVLMLRNEAVGTET